ncbi:MAG: outer membrane beta-barrel protein [Bacteroidia bacterium]|nr:outer membrane beta-barrel protein [Bacteroidia bacterium]
MKNKNRTESEIFAHIKQSLESYEEAYIPGSWEGFVQKRRIRQRKLFLRIASGIAACLLLGFFGVNLVHFEKRDNLKSTVEQTTSSIRITPEVKTKSTKKTEPSMVSLKPVLKQFKSPGTESKANSILKENLIAKGENRTAEHPVVSILAVDSTKKNSTIAANVELQSNNNEPDTIKSSSDTIRSETTKTFLNTPPAKENQNLADASRRKVRFGINFSPGVNTSQSSGSFNYMGGLSADISLFANVQLSTGLQIENQSTLKKMQGIVSSSTVPQNESKTKLINLDLPVNITWKFVSEKSHAYYVSAGLSSLIHLKQEIRNTTYSQDLIPASSLVNGEVIKTYSIVEQVSITQNTVAPTQTFNFAGRINFMVGFEKKLTDRLFIHIEPYAKVPTPGQAQGNLNQTTTGINFKISF